MAEKPLCFVVMPFGMKKDPAGGPDIDFNTIYEQGIQPAIEDAGLEPIRADAEVAGGIIHKPMYERLMLCDYAVADLTTANANVFYEIGVRHAIRPSTTVMIFAKHQSIPFDVAPLRALPYELAKKNRFGAAEAAGLRKSLGDRLKELRTAATTEPLADSPIFQLLKDYKAPEIAHLKTDVFRSRASYSDAMKKRLTTARRSRDVAGATAVEQELGPLHEAELGVLVDLYLTYRALEQWGRMIDLFDRFPVELKRNVMMREQLGFALNRAGRGDEALETLEAVVEEQGDSSETCALIGRVYKDRWQSAEDPDEADGHLRRAIDWYVRGFDADWRDAYPGVNAVTLLDIRGDDESLAKKREMLAVVRFAVNRKMQSKTADYWDHATLLELAVLENDEKAAKQHFGDALACIREPWEPKTTANNLGMIAAAREKRGEAQAWVAEMVGRLKKAGER